MQAIRIIDIYAKYIKKFNTRLSDKIILINTPTICIINMYAKIIWYYISNSYWPFKVRKYVAVQFGPKIYAPCTLHICEQIDLHVNLLTQPIGWEKMAS